MSAEIESSDPGERSTFSAWLEQLAHFSDHPTHETPPFQLGDLLLGRYVLEREIGRGGMGVVYEALDCELQARCALKTLRKIGPERLVMLKNEFRSIARIQHANLVRPGELREHGAHWFYTMELVDGHDPIEWTGGELQRVRTVLSGLADVLATVHAHGVVHRDVKPANVISTDQRSVLLDLGLARDSRRRLWFDREEVGTTRYMAPELSTGGSASPASDMYSLGVLLFELACASVPQTNPSARSILELRGPAFGELDEICHQLLSPDPERRPTAAQLANRLGGTQSSVGVATSSSMDFVGRAIELERMRGAYEHARTGNFATMFVHGASGLGKTALVEHFVARCDDALVLSGRCYESETVPFKGIDDVVDAIAVVLAGRPDVAASLPIECAALGQGFPSLTALLPASATTLQTTDPEGANQMLVGALHAMLAALARVAPLILVIDDLQWIDNDGLRLLANVLALAPRGCFVIATSRAPEPPEALAAVDNASAIRLQPLSPEDAAKLARSFAPGDLELSRIVDSARGQPYLICELAMHRANATLAPEVRRVLELVAVAGAPLPARVFAAAAELSLASLDDCLRDLAVRRLVRWRGVGAAATVEPFHDRVREDLNREFSRVHAVAAHDRIASALLALMPDSHARLATHLARAERPVEAAAHALLAAARARESGAFAHAADLYSLALESGVDDPQPIRERHAEMRMLAWQPLAAANAFRIAADSASRDRAGALRMLAVEQSLIGGDLAHGLGELALVLRRAGVSVPRRGWSALATMLIRRAELRLRRFRRGLRLRRDHLTAEEIDLLAWAASAVMMIDAPLALGYHTRSLLAILELDDPIRLARSLGTEACIQAATASLDEAERLIRETEAIGTEHKEVVQLALRAPRMVLGVQRGAWQEVLAIGSRPAPHHTAWHNASRELYLAHCEYNLGRFADLERRCDRGLRSAAEREDRWLELVMSVSFAPMVALVHNDPDRARKIVERGRELLWRGGRGGYLHALSACAARFADLYTGDHDRALAAWVGPGSDMIARKSHYGRVYLEFLGATAALGAMRSAGRKRGLRVRVERAIRGLSRDPVPWAKPYAALLSAQLEPSRRATHLATARAGFAHFEINHMVDVIDRVGEPAAADARLRERGVVRPERFVAMFAPAISVD